MHFVQFGALLGLSGVPWRALPAPLRLASPRALTPIGPSPRLPEPADDVLAAAKARRSPDISPSGRRRRRGGHEGEGGGREGGGREGGREGGAAEGGRAGREASPAGVRVPAPAPYEAPKSHGAKHHVKHHRPRQRAIAASDAEREAWVKERDADPHARARPSSLHPSRGGQSHRRTAADGEQSVRRPRSPEVQRRGNSPEAQRRPRSGKRPDSGAAEGMTKPGSAALAALTTGSSAQKFADSKRDEDGLLFA